MTLNAPAVSPVYEEPIPLITCGLLFDGYCQRANLLIEY
jgi:hypothetical protein